MMRHGFDSIRRAGLAGSVVLPVRYLTEAFLVMTLLVAACTKEAWYQGAQDAQRQECYRLPHGEVQECLDRVNRIGYEQYRREREEMQEE
jgi:hypothetical protein